MEWDDEARSEQADSLRWLLDEYESGRLTRDMRRQFKNGFTTLEVIRAITELVNYAEDIKDEARA
jgi:hypothetical protein